MTWAEVPFETLYTEPSRNGVYKPKEAHGEGAKIVNMGELFAHDFVGSQDMARLAMTEHELEISGLKNGDLLFGRRSLVESGAGKCSIVTGLVEPTTFESSLIRTRLDTGVVEPLFIYYWFKSPQGRGRIRAIVSGTNVKGIRGSDLKRVMVARPDISVQRRIAAALKDYDDLIENNRKRVALLEAVARFLYREWFVHLRFPGHQHVKVVDGIPEGWERRPLGACTTFQSGGTPSRAKSEYWEGNVPWISSGELTSMRISASTQHVTDEAVRVGSRYADVGTVLGVVRGMSLAKEFRLGVVTRRVCFNQDLKAFVPDRGIESLYLFHAIDEQRERIRQSAGEASHGTKKLETAVLEALPVPIPPQAVRQHFVEYAAPIHRQMDVLVEQNTRLTQGRELLLPRLMSGEIAF